MMVHPGDDRSASDAQGPLDGRLRTIQALESKLDMMCASPGGPGVMLLAELHELSQVVASLALELRKDRP